MKTIYEWTGEYRPPKKGEWFLTPTSSQPKQAEINYATAKHWILSPRQKEATKDE